MKINELFPKKYLQAVDLGGKPRTLQIRCIQFCKMRNPTDEVDTKGKRVYEVVKKPVVFFHKKFAGVVLNKTRTGELAAALAIEDTDHAADRWIVAYPDGNQIHFRAAPTQPQPAAVVVDQQTGEVMDGQPSE